ncbi:MAG: OadG family protein [Lentisphaeria bacterium]|nr:OadG family protein [Lentisphaeria bacterium]MDY0175684.1 OadG family protein [Lentisphaeria bacterium]NLZ60696.1 OadG family protein [Lentisphaerota bacterium]
MEVIVNSLVISILGIGFVFLFLLIQVALTNYMARLAAKYSYLLPEPQKPLRKKPAAVKPASDSGDDADEIVAVITAAIQAHRAG